jgi:hypothetical protein
MKFKIILTTCPERDTRIAEIWHGDSLIVDLEPQISKAIKINIYSCLKTPCWELDLDEWINTLTEAKETLL